MIKKLYKESHADAVRQDPTPVHVQTLLKAELFQKGPGVSLVPNQQKRISFTSIFHPKQTIMQNGCHQSKLKRS